MRASTLVMTAFAVMFGLLAVFLANTWLNRQAELRAKSMETQVQQPAAHRTIVVASQPLRFGTELAAGQLKEIPWSEDNLPAGAYATIADVLKSGRRVVLSPIEAQEPILAVKVTGAGQRASLSALVREGMKAVTIRVNDVEGVGGFVLPGDHVDVVLTRQIDKERASTEVVLQNTRVLAVDQQADVRADKAAVAKAVTLEVAMAEAQRLWLAASVGNLSLLLRKAGETAQQTTRKVTLSDLNGTPEAEAPSTTRRINVTRGSERKEYSVPPDAPRAAPDRSSALELGGSTVR